MPKEISRKQIAFDFDTAALQTYYPSNNWRNGYLEIKLHMKNNGFDWQQGSVYVSENAMTVYEAINHTQNLLIAAPWLNKCMRDCTVTNIGKQFSLNNLFDKDADVPSRAELIEKEDEIDR